MLPPVSIPANSVAYKPCPFCGMAFPEVHTDPISKAQAIMCRNRQCGAGAPAPSWNRRKGFVKLVAKAEGR